MASRCSLQRDEVVNVRISWQSDADHFANLTKEGPHGILVNVKRQVAHEKRIALRTDAVTVLFGALCGTVLRSRVVGSCVGVIKVECAPIQLFALHRFKCLSSSVRVGEVDVAEPAAAAAHLVRHNTGIDQPVKFLECLEQSVVVNAPAQTTGKEGTRSRSVVDLGLFRSGIDLFVSLTLLGRGSLLGLRLI